MKIEIDIKLAEGLLEDVDQLIASHWWNNEEESTRKKPVDLVLIEMERNELCGLIAKKIITKEAKNEHSN